MIHDLAVSFPPDKVRVHIIHSLREDSPETIEKDFSHDHITLEYVPMGDKRAYIPAIRAIARRVKQFHPQVVHFHSSKAGFLGRFVVREKKTRKVFYSPHGFSFLRTDVPGAVRSLFALLEKFAAVLSRCTIITVSPSEQQAALKITSRSVMIPNFIDLSAYSDKYIENKTPLVVTSGRIAPQKNPGLFREIANLLPEVQFLWIGDGPLKNELAGVQNIEITGMVTRERVLELLGTSWVYLQTSLWEGMSISILEAMASAKPVVATECTGNLDLIEQGKTGYLCSPEQKELFVSSLQKLVDNMVLRKTLGEQARKSVVEKYSMEAVKNQYLTAYG